METSPPIQVERVTAPAAEPLSLAEVKLFLRIEHSEEDTLLSSLIVAAREAAESWTGRSLITQSQRLRWMPPTHTLLFLPRGPVQSIQTVELADETGALTTLDVDLYRLHAARGMLQFAAVPQAAEVIVTYVAGYGDLATDVPALVRQGMLQHIAELYEKREQASAMPPDVARVMYQPYRELRL